MLSYCWLLCFVVRDGHFGDSYLDRQKISHIFRTPGTQKTATSESLTANALNHSYGFAMLAMMTWALLYHSVFGLAFLFMVFSFTALYDSCKWCFRLSPVLLIYVEFLLIAQYVYSLDLVPGKELPVSSILEIIGFRKAASRSVGLVTLVVKIILSLPFVVLLRLFLRERYYDSLTEHDRRKRLTYGTFEDTEHPAQPLTSIPEGANTSGRSVAFDFFTRFFTKFWIFLVAFVLLVNALSSPPVDYTAGYLVLWCVLIILLNISFPFFRNVVFLFWTLLIVYSSVLLVAVYTYQFPSVPQFWQQHTHLSAEDFAKIGLVDYQDEHNSSLLFVRLLLPILLVLVTMLQLKFFHDPWVKLVQSPAGSRTGSDVTEQGGDSDTVARSAIQALKQGLREFAEVLWRFAEVHLPKLVLFILIITAASHVCVLNLVLVVFVSLAVCLPALSAAISLLLTVYLALSAVTRVVYLIHFQNVNDTQLIDFGQDTCPEIRVNGTLVPLAEWLGFGNTDSVFEHDFVGLIIVLVTIAIRLAVYYRQKFMRKLRGLPTPPSDLIFPDHEAKDFDRSLRDCLKYFLNYGFYKFGIEVSMIMMAIVAWTRMDLVGCLVIFWLFLVALLPRRLCRTIWPILLLYLAITLPLQYAMWIGLPEELCIAYPWSSWLVPDPNAETTILGDNLLRFLDLSNYRQAPEHSIRFLVVDFLLLLAVGAQERVFRQERTSHPAGDNYTIYTDGNYALRRNNPTYDFIAEQKSFVDYFKLVIFNYGHWITLVMVLVAGLGGTSLFALGYLVLAFWMLWQGNNLYTMRNYNKTLARWNFLLFYTIFAMLCKVSLQVVGCVFLSPLVSSPGCVVRQLFSIVCVDQASCDGLVALPATKDAVFSCAVEARETRIGFDTIALSFIIFQLRVLHSWYFQHCMIDFRCEIVQSHRGALLINQLIEKEMKEQDLQQKAKVEDITKRTAAIRRQYEEQQHLGSEKPFIPQTYGQGWCF
uniref:Piezo-type mechanosensitive ion channel component n=1 Tax=Panagrellus redivivus TaxID=6233 RepID=A0A7E4ZUG3_PANRE